MTTSVAGPSALRRIAAIAALAASACAGACSSVESGSTSTSGATTPSTTWSAPLIVDGDISEWPRDLVAFADDAYLYLRFSVDGEMKSLQASDQTVTLHLDIDGDGGTGFSMLDPVDAAGMGVDLEVEFSPRKSDGTLDRGAAAYVVDRAGVRTRIPVAGLDLLFTPTHASAWYEARISRHVATGTDTTALEQAGPWEGVITLRDSGGSLRAWSDAFAADKPAASAQPPLADATIPPRADGAIRVLNWNIHRNSPEKSPEAFTRVIEATRPDVVLLQEWVVDDPAQIQRWFHEHVESPTGTWHALAGKAWGVAIVAPYPITPLLADGVTFQNDGRDHNARLVSGVVALPVGDIVVGSTHLKCCGSSESQEDATRIAEASQIAAALARAMEKDPSWVRVLAGDMNLVGTRRPLDEIRRGLDVDGSDLEIAPVRVLGDRAVYTWVDWQTEFTPGRLDYVLHSGAGSRVLNASAIDTRRLSDSALARMGLQRADSQASDHLPILVDIAIRR
jgi:endonuclease/exonuclease/phosphatase family metal-dependent hydrolase